MTSIATCLPQELSASTEHHNDFTLKTRVSANLTGGISIECVTTSELRASRRALWHAPAMHRRWGMTAAALGFTGVALGAFGAHGLTRLVEGLPDAADRLRWWETAARFHLVHALALGLAASLPPNERWIRLAGAGFTAGVVLFSGSLYVMALTGVRALGAVTPLGGLAQLAGWLALFLTFRSAPKP